MKHEYHTCDKCHDVVHGPIYNYTGPYNVFDLCTDCNAALKEWLGPAGTADEHDEPEIKGIKPWNIDKGEEQPS